MHGTVPLQLGQGLDIERAPSIADRGVRADAADPVVFAELGLHLRRDHPGIADLAEVEDRDDGAVARRK